MMGRWIWAGMLMLLLVSACKTSDSYRLVRQSDLYYENSNHRLSLILYYDYKIEEVPKQQPKKVVAEFVTLNPYFKCTLLREAYDKSSLPGSVLPIELANDTLFDGITYQIREGKPYLNAYFTGDQKQFVLQATGDVDSKIGIINEYRKILESIRVGNDYQRTDILESPFSVARKKIFTHDSSLNYLLPIEALLREEANYQGQDVSHYQQAFLTITSRIENAAYEYDLTDFYSSGYFARKKVSDIECISAPSEWRSRIGKMIGDHRLVMFNENHFDPRGRLLMQELLPLLRERGFTHIGFEGLWESGDSIMQRGYPVSTSGFYVQEPKFADLLRKAIGLGFQVFGYDEFDEEREAGQAQNIARKLSDEKVKIAVFAGFGHIHEGDSGRQSMAVVLKELSGIDPLTFDQTEFHSNCKEGELGFVAEKPKGVKTILTDHYLSNDISAYQDPDLFPISLDTLYRDVKYPATLELYYTNELRETTRAIPVRVYLIDEEVKPVVRVDAGNYELRVKNRYGEIVKSAQISVNREGQYRPAGSR